LLQEALSLLLVPWLLLPQLAPLLLLIWEATCSMRSWLHECKSLYAHVPL
jgi:hypothetical protein